MTYEYNSDRLLNKLFEEIDRVLVEEPKAEPIEAMVSILGAALNWQNSKHVMLCELIMDLCLELEKRACLCC